MNQSKNFYNHSTIIVLQRKMILPYNQTRIELPSSNNSEEKYLWTIIIVNEMVYRDEYLLMYNHWFQIAFYMYLIISKHIFYKEIKYPKTKLNLLLPIILKYYCFSALVVFNVNNECYSRHETRDSRGAISS